LDGPFKAEDDFLPGILCVAVQVMPAIVVPHSPPTVLLSPLPTSATTDRVGGVNYSLYISRQG